MAPRMESARHMNMHGDTSPQSPSDLMPQAPRRRGSLQGSSFQDCTGPIVRNPSHQSPPNNPPGGDSPSWIHRMKSRLRKARKRNAADDDLPSVADPPSAVVLPSDDCSTWSYGASTLTSWDSNSIPPPRVDRNPPCGRWQQGPSRDLLSRPRGQSNAHFDPLEMRASSLTHTGAQQQPRNFERFASYSEENSPPQPSRLPSVCDDGRSAASTIDTRESFGQSRPSLNRRSLCGTVPSNPHESNPPVQQHPRTDTSLLPASQSISASQHTYSQSNLQHAPTTVSATSVVSSSDYISGTSGGTEGKMLQVVPGVEMSLRGKRESWEAVQEGRITVTACIGCKHELNCIMDALLVACPYCTLLSPVVQTEEGPDSSSYGIGIGLKPERVAQWIERNT